MESKIECKFKEIYDVESDNIFRFCFLRVSTREQALDIMQDTFLRLWQSLNSDKEIVNYKAFLFTVARHLIIDWYRKKKSISLENIMYKEGEDFLRLDHVKISNIMNLAEGRYLVDKINELTPIYRNSVYLRFVEGLSPPEIAEILGVSANVASVRVNRGLIELRKKTGYDDKQ